MSFRFLIMLRDYTLTMNHDCDNGECNNESEGRHHVKGVCCES